MSIKVINYYNRINNIFRDEIYKNRSETYSASVLLVPTNMIMLVYELPLFAQPSRAPFMKYAIRGVVGN